MELLHEAPDPTTFTPLSEHQATTPASFFSGPPVLHLRCPRATLRLRKPTAPALAKFAGIDEARPNGDAAATKTAAESSNAAAATAAEPAVRGDDDDEEVVPDVTVYVLSTSLLLQRPASNAALTIPYPAIGLHAAAGDGLYLQISAAGGSHAPPAFDDHDPNSSIEATIVPSAADGGADGVPAPSADPEAQEQAPPVQALFAALSACANLHPDPMEEDGPDEDGEGEQQPAFEIRGAEGMPPPMPGSGGWITAENMDQFFDEEGNWKGGGPEPRLGLGPGAGSVREREGDGMEEDELDETKWQRTD